MSFKQQFIDSFITGLGRSCAALFLFGVATGVYYMGTVEHPKEKEENKSDIYAQDHFKKLFDKLK
jgi:hypothetical protein